MPSYPLCAHRLRVLSRISKSHLALVLACGVVGACGSDSGAAFRDSAEKSDSGGGATSDSSSPDGSVTIGDASIATDAMKLGTGGSKGDNADANSGSKSHRDAEAIDALNRDASFRDAAHAKDGSASAPDGSAGGATQDGGAGGCAMRTAFYMDGDGDGYGRTAGATVACKKPATGKWALRDGDCDDSNPDVHPGQTTYFGNPYKLQGGVDSFDCDCSGAEDPDLSQPIAPANCGLLSLTLCGGSGYAQTTRTGPGVNPLCGSTVKSTCQAALGILVCQSVTETVTQPFACR